MSGVSDSLVSEKFTGNQRKALTDDRHVIVVANAGSGKTRVFVERYLRLITRKENPVPPQNIVAITFTEKAAGELVKKIGDEVRARMDSAESDERRRLQQCADALLTANITTIHAFCRRLLNDYPIESGVDPGFSIISDVDKELLVSEVVRENIEAVLGTPDDLLHDPLKRLFNVLGRTHGTTRIRIIATDHRELPAGASCENARAATASALVENYYDALNMLPEFQGSRPGWFALLDTAIRKGVFKEDSAGSIRDILRNWTPDSDLVDRMQWYTALFDMLLTKDGKGFRKNHLIAGESSGIDLDALLHSMQVSRERLKGLTGHDKRSLGESLADFADQQVTVMCMAARIRSAIAKRMEERNLLDFYDLQYRALRMLERPDVAEKVHREYPYIMVDEYQDTDPLQHRIVMAISANLTRGNVFVVGDPKQSIYRFRGADVEMFNDMRKAVLSRQKELAAPLPGFENDESITDEEKSGCILLKESFRLPKENAAFINRVFASEAMDLGVFYTPFVSGIPRGLETHHGTIEILCAGRNETEDDGQVDLLGKSIVTLLKSKRKVRMKTGLETVKPGHIAVLIRKHDHLQDVLQALRRYSVPYEVSKGGGFYFTQEVWDVANYLRFLMLPHDDVALMGVLRSPFFDLSDALLYRVSKNPGSILWEKLQHGLEGNQGELISDITRRLKRVLELANRLPVSLFIQNLLAEHSWYAVAASRQRGEQSIANIDKLLDIARSFEGEGRQALFDFARVLERYLDNKIREKEAEFEPDPERVQILTVHASKGLEFPVVYLPFLDRNAGKVDETVYMPGIGFVWKPYVDRQVTKKKPSPVYEIARFFEKAKQAQEETRLYYVGMTRAMDTLVLCTSEKYGAGSIFGRISAALNLSLSESSFTVTDHLDVLHLQTDRPSYERLQVRIDVPVISSIDSDQPYQLLGTRTEYSPRVHVLDRLQRQSVLTTTATRLAYLHWCERRYLLSGHLDFPVPTSGQRGEDLGKPSSGDLGTLVHKVIELDLQEDRIADWLKLHGADDMMASVLEHVRNFRAHELYRQLNELHEGSVRREVALSASLDGDIVEGTMDVLFKRDEDWEIIDFKTSRGNLDSLRIRYEPQMNVYALLVSGLNVSGNVRAWLFSTTLGEVVSLSYSPQRLQHLRADISRDIKRMKQILSGGRADANREHCFHCPYRLQDGACILDR